MKPEKGGPTSRSLGHRIESLTCAHLQKSGLRLVSRNYQNRLGEIDLIFRDRDVLVFVEVRYRRQPSHGRAVETVDFQKQRKVLRTAAAYLQENGLYDQVACRFDVVGVTEQDGRLVCEWLKNAFQ